MENKTISEATVLITGGTGSFGSNMTRHLLQKGVSELRILSRDEAKQDLMRQQLGDSRVRFIIGDTRDEKSVNSAVKGCSYVFHAAALKQVPSAEFFPLEAVKTNIEGSANVIRASFENDVDALVCLSTDKAVYPINAMGMSKALMEKTALAYARENSDARTRVLVTRYGNVMYSRGSVIPRFIGQIKSGKNLTITEPKMTRFLMSLAESVDLVEFAFTEGSSGDLLVRKAPATDLNTLALAVVKIFGNPDHCLETIGYRHGEKLFESLLSLEEREKALDLGGYFRVPLDDRDLNYENFFEKGEVRQNESEAYTSHNTIQLDVDQVVEKLLALPEIQLELAA